MYKKKIKCILNKTFEHAFHFVKENVWLQMEDFRHPRELPNRLPDEDRLPIRSVTSNKTLFKRGKQHLPNFHFMEGMHDNILLTGIFIFYILNIKTKSWKLYLLRDNSILLTSEGYLRCNVLIFFFNIFWWFIDLLVNLLDNFFLKIIQKWILSRPIKRLNCNEL